MKLTLTVKSQEIKEVEVSFPIFSSHHLDNVIIYSRRDEDGTCFSIWDWYLSSDDIHLEVKKEGKLTSGDDYYLGKGEYSSNESEFNAAKSKFMDHIQKL